jgi:hypothetical protein
MDMDGVLWRGAQPLGDLPSLFGQISRYGWQAVLVTNNATRSVDFTWRSCFLWSSPGALAGDLLRRGAGGPPH